MGVLILLTLAVGCVGPRARFTSYPEGVTVQVGDRSGRTPCTLPVPESVDTAVFTADGGQTLTQSLVGVPRIARPWYAGPARVTSRACQGLSLPFLGAGMLGLYLVQETKETEPFHEERDDDLEWELVGLSFGSLAVGGGLYGLGSWLEGLDPGPVPRIHVDLLPDAAAATNALVPLHAP